MSRSLTEGPPTLSTGARIASLVRGRPLLGVVVVVVILVLAYFVADAPAARAAVTLTQEFGYLSAPAGTRLVKQESRHKPGQADFGAEYETSLSYPQIRSFYDSELGRGGWRLVSDDPLTDSGGGAVGRIACYRKVEFWAVLQYFANREGSPADYAVDLAWGSSVCS
jgi:hypothetical protein